jgi:hypothetical protein
MGSTVAAVLRHARCAVLTVPTHTTATNMSSKFMRVRDDENAPGPPLISPATRGGIDDISTHNAEGE